MNTYTIKFTDGTVLENLELNGNNFISKTPITEDFFEDNLYNIEINGEIHPRMKLVHLAKDMGKYWFILADISPEEIEKERQSSINEYLAMKLGIDLEEVIN